MADLVAVQRVSLVASGTSAQTYIQLNAPTNQRVKLKEVGISFAGTVNTNAPVNVQLVIQTTAGTASAGTPVATDGDVAETIQATTRVTFTAEPTYAGVLREWNVHPQTGIIVPLPLAKPPVLKGGTRVGLVVTAGVTVNASAYIEWEE